MRKSYRVWRSCIAFCLFFRIYFQIIFFHISLVLNMQLVRYWYWTSRILRFCNLFLHFNREFVDPFLAISPPTIQVLHRLYYRKGVKLCFSLAKIKFIFLCWTIAAAFACVFFLQWILTVARWYFSLQFPAAVGRRCLLQESFTPFLFMFVWH